MEYIQLNNGVKMPIVGFGVFQIQSHAQCEQGVVDAIHAGYRLIDTAAVYGNEAAVGSAIRKCGVARKELFITSKLWVQDAGYEAAKKATAIIQHITYDVLDDRYDTDLFTEVTIKGKLDVNAMKADKHLFDHIVYDSTNERKFAKELEAVSDVADSYQALLSKVI